MNVWILHVGEELQVDSAPRLFRYGYLAESLLRQGHQVLRWAPTFQHARKQQRFDTDKRVEVAPGHDNQFVYARGYRRNVSWARMRSYRYLATRFRKLALEHARPDIIVSGIPSLDWCEAAVDFGVAQGVPVVIDVRDLWPDIFETALPRALRPLGRSLLSSFHRQADRICRQATALTAVSESYLQWGLQRANRPQRETDRVIPLGYRQQNEGDGSPDASLLAGLRRQGVDFNKTICCFFGLFEKSYDLRTIIDAARQFQEAGRTDVQFVLCGAGSQEASLRRRAAGLPNVIFLGWVNPATIAAVMSVSKIGLAAYGGDAMQSLPNKPFEYMAGRLAVVSSLQGELAELLAENQCGVTYSPGSSREIYEAIACLMDAPANLEHLRRQADLLQSNRFDANRLADDFATHLEDIRSNQINSLGKAA